MPSSILAGIRDFAIKICLWIIRGGRPLTKNFWLDRLTEDFGLGWFGTGLGRRLYSISGPHACDDTNDMHRRSLLCFDLTDREDGGENGRESGEESEAEGEDCAGGA